MTTEQAAVPAPTAQSVSAELLEFFATRTKAPVTADQDLFATGVVSSMFAMELVVKLESGYDIAIVGADLKMANFRTVDTMVELVLRLRDANQSDG